MEKAEDAYEKKAYEKAISYAKQALEKKKEDALAYAVIGKSYYQKKEDEAAKAYLEKAVEKQQKDKEVYRFLIDLTKILTMKPSVIYTMKLRIHLFKNCFGIIL